MKVTIYGTRGSFPSTLPEMSRYGGDTTCISVKTDAGDIIIIDAGIGIRQLGNDLSASQEGGECSLCFTHRHWDHVHGLTSFTPLYSPNWKVSLYGPQYGDKIWLDTLETLFDNYYFPFAWGNIAHKTPIIEFEVGESFNIGSALIETCNTNHPGGCSAYKITADGWTFFFSGDHEWGDESSPIKDDLQAFIKGSDVILADAHFSDEDYKNHKGWGHSTMNQWIDHALKADVSRLIFTHHHPDYTDNDLESHIDAIWRKQPQLKLKLTLARLGLIIDKEGAHSQIEAVHRASCKMCDFSRRVSRYADPGIILERVLTEAKHIGKADAGTVYLITDTGDLTFSYAQNDTLFSGSAVNKMIYLNAVVPMTKSSIAGYVAIKATSLNISDVRSLPSSVPYGFNDSFDKSTGYYTVSMLTVPLIGSNDEVVGVLQLINSLKNGKPQAFTLDMQNQLEQLAVTAADSIERSRLSNELIVRMLKTSALRDPTETAGHVMRVGSMAAETYHRLAEKRGIPADELRKTKDTIRLAAMLHDIGKVGIPDAVLKKPGKLTNEEFDVIKSHCAMGAGLFINPSSNLDIMAYNIALHHHQKWDGSGYTGDPTKPQLSGLDIPLEARITSVADVYDALVSTRCYKEPMPIERALGILQKDAGTHFDPEVVESFIEIQAVIQAITARFEG